eukprot:TRINITY_DN24118_c0_g1_i2.p1 TRINITY_DN24118_c0_g1~~TRINITY_DN24118_c0_g1_i2.p1  ORF type:complete len:409 (+),score=72.48 TRINITY_DN24118_c0_g1_i2:56-1228(+)
MASRKRPASATTAPREASRGRKCSPKHGEEPHDSEAYRWAMRQVKAAQDACDRRVAAAEARADERVAAAELRAKEAVAAAELRAKEAEDRAIERGIEVERCARKQVADATAYADERVAKVYEQICTTCDERVAVVQQQASEHVRSAQEWADKRVAEALGRQTSGLRSPIGPPPSSIISSQERKSEDTAQQTALRVLEGTTNDETLNLPSGADQAAVTSQYRKLSLMFHPDKHHGCGEQVAPFLTAAYCKVNAAYSKKMKELQRQEEGDEQGVPFEPVVESAVVEGASKHRRLAVSLMQPVVSDLRPTGHHIVHAPITYDAAGEPTKWCRAGQASGGCNVIMLDEQKIGTAAVFSAADKARVQYLRLKIEAVNAHGSSPPAFADVAWASRL